MDERQDGKRKALREHGTLNVRASEVKDPLFQNSEFFDPQDLVLVKYEMLRRVRVEGSSVAAAARAFPSIRPWQRSRRKACRVCFRDGAARRRQTS
jgi:hypothetical protein